MGVCKTIVDKPVGIDRMHLCVIRRYPRELSTNPARENEHNSSLLDVTVLGDRKTGTVQKTGLYLAHTK